VWPIHGLAVLISIKSGHVPSFSLKVGQMGRVSVLPLHANVRYIRKIISDRKNVPPVPSENSPDATASPRLLTAELQGAAAQLAGLLESAMDAIITVNEEQHIVLYNRAAENIFGWPAEQMLGQPLAQLIPERFQAAHGEHVRRFGSTGVTSRRMGGPSVV
jgi:PAS domain-containing protein